MIQSILVIETHDEEDPDILKAFNDYVTALQEIVGQTLFDCREFKTDELQVVKDTDNRDTKTTWITTDHGFRVEVDPVELFLNMLENHPGYDNLKNDFDEFLGRMDQEMDKN